MTAKQIMDGLALRKVMAIESGKLADCTHKATNYCYTMEREFKMLSAKGYAGFQRIYTIWNPNNSNPTPLFVGDIIRDRDMARGFVMSIWVYFSTYAEMNPDHLHIFLETRLLLEEMMCGGWYE